MEASENMENTNLDPIAACHELEAKLKSHDWYHMMSDDSSVYRKGTRSWESLLAYFQWMVDAGFRSDAEKVWNEHAPKEFTR